MITYALAQYTKVLIYVLNITYNVHKFVLTIQKYEKKTFISRMF